MGSIPVGQALRPYSRSKGDDEFARPFVPQPLKVHPSPGQNRYNRAFFARERPKAQDSIVISTANITMQYRMGLRGDLRVVKSIT